MKAALSILVAICIFFGFLYLQASPKKVPSDKKVLVFSATWCGPCQYMKRSVWPTTKVQKALEDFGYEKMDIDFNRNQALVQKYNVTQLPTLVLVKWDGEKWVEFKRRVGAMGTEQLIDFLR